MKSVYFIVMMVLLSALPATSQAEIYKWKDKEGNTRYSDTPPPSNIQSKNIGVKKSAVPAGKQPLSPVTDSATAPLPVISKDNVLEVPAKTAEDVAAEQRQQKAENEKNNKREKEIQAKLKAENCKAAKENYASYAQGGRVYKMNENGEREYMDDAGLKLGAEKARGQMAQFCN